MNLLNLFKQKKSTSTARVLEASATLYTGRILIETVDRVKQGFGISSSKISALPVDASSELVGSALRYHLSLTQHNLAIPEDYRKHYKDFLSAAGFKTAKEHHKDALHLTVHEID